MTGHIRHTRNEAERQVCYEIRTRVFVAEQGVPSEEELDDYDGTAMHFVVEVHRVIVGTARLVDLGNGVGKIGRVAILKEHRNRGLGSELIRYVMDTGFAACHTLVLDSQISAIPFYERFGFWPEGEIFLDAGIEHRRMRLSW